MHRSLHRNIKLEVIEFTDGAGLGLGGCTFEPATHLCTHGCGNVLNAFAIYEFNLSFLNYYCYEGVGRRKHVGLCFYTRDGCKHACAHIARSP